MTKATAKTASKKSSGHGGKRTGAGRPKKYQEHLVTFSVCVPLSIAQRISDIAEQSEESRSAIISNLIAKSLSKP